MKRKMPSDNPDERAASAESANHFADDPDHHAIVARRNWLVALALAGMASTTACGDEDRNTSMEAGADQAVPQTSSRADSAGAEVAVNLPAGAMDGGWGDDLDAGSDAPTCQGCQGGMCQGCT